MDEEIQSILDDVEELKRTNPWLADFYLSDEEIKKTIELVGRIVLGEERLDNFLPNLFKVLNKDQEFINRLALAIAQNRFLPLARIIGDVAGLIKKLGGSAAATQPQSALMPKQTADAASFSFDQEDEAEVNGFKNLADSGQKSSYEQLAAEIISKFGYNETDEVMRKRLESTVVARLKDVRDELETKEALEKNHKTGGLDFSAEQSKNILDIIKTESARVPIVKEASPFNYQPKAQFDFPTKKPFVQKEKINLFEKAKKAKPVEEEKNNLPIQEKAIQSAPEFITPIPVKEMAKPFGSISLPPGKMPLKIKNDKDGLPVIQMPDELMVKPKMMPVQPMKPKIESALIQNIKEENILAPLPPKSAMALPPSPAPYPAPRVSTSPVNAQISSKPSLDGVKFTKKLVGPIDELGQLTLIDFRRMSEKVADRIVKIKEKIDLLERESYGRKLEGIAAWHKSEVNRFYRLIGQTSMGENKSVETIIGERLATSKPTLSLEEFEAVMGLNRELRY